jgi:hypothetical protein
MQRSVWSWPVVLASCVLSLGALAYVIYSLSSYRGAEARGEIPSAVAIAATTPPVLWQIGSPWVIANTGQCGTPTFPTPTSADFVLVRNGMSCQRNQLNPVGNGSDSVYRLTDGQVYEWDFQTTTNMGIDSGKYSQRLIFQIHQYACGASPNTVLGIQNLTGTQEWYILSGGKTVTLPYVEGATDTWKFVAKIAPDSTGTEQWWHNGTLAMDTTGSNFTCGTNPFWNFGPYMWNWLNQGGGTSALNQVEILFDYMTLVATDGQP